MTKGKRKKLALLIRVDPNSDWKNIGLVKSTASLPVSGIILVTSIGVQVYLTVDDLRRLVQGLTTEKETGDNGD